MRLNGMRNAPGLYCRIYYAQGRLTSGPDTPHEDKLCAAAEHATEAFGEPDILVNCAGLNLRPELGDLSEDVVRVS